MKNNSVRFYHIDCVNGEWIQQEKVSTILDVFKGGVLVEWEGRPQGKCIASENVIEINYNN